MGLFSIFLAARTTFEGEFSNVTRSYAKALERKLPLQQQADQLGLTAHPGFVEDVGEIAAHRSNRDAEAVGCRFSAVSLDDFESEGRFGARQPEAFAQLVDAAAHLDLRVGDEHRC